MRKQTRTVLIKGVIAICHVHCFSPSNVPLNIQFSLSVVSNPLRPHEPQHTRPRCPSPTPRVHQTHVHWVCDAIQPSHPLPSLSLPALSLSQYQGLFKCQLFASGSQSFGVSASISVPPMNTQDGSALGWTDWICLQSKGLSKVFSNSTVQKHQFFSTNFLYTPILTSIHDHWKNHILD